MIYFCSQKKRRALVLLHSTLNGIDFLEVSDKDGDCGKQLLITLLKDATQLKLTPSQIQIVGGSSRAQVKAVSVSLPAAAAPRLLTVELDRSGDFSSYTLSLVAGPSTSDPPDGFDPQLSTITFSFKAGCATAGDCLPSTCCPPVRPPEPDINYLAKDYDTFRQMMLDRIAVLAPTWRESHPSDIGIALVELLAYSADHLSYRQDAVGTEAYLGTARSRISLRRHARLVDYRLSEGSNARTWVYIEVSKQAPKDGVFVPFGTLIFPQVSGFPAVVDLADYPQAPVRLRSGMVTFATMQEATVYQEQNEMHFYTWDDSNCCLANGATEATLIDNLPSLQPGNVLIFEEVIGPNTGNRQDADPKKRWAVRLTEVHTADHLGSLLVDPRNQQPITRIRWASEDALPFPLCISSTTDPEHGSRPVQDTSVARGNIIPADHGIWQDRPLSGSVALTNGSPQVIGFATSFINTVEVGQWLVFSTDVTHTPYQISAVIDDKHLTLTSSYEGATTLSAVAAMVTEDLGQVPEAPAAPVLETSCACNSQSSPLSRRPRYFPKLAYSPLTFAWPLDNSVPASHFLAPSSNGTSRPAPQISIIDDQQQWQILDDLLSSDDSKHVCVLEIERDGTAFVRFGDGQYGVAPEPGTDFHAHYRVGNGTIGNIGRDTLRHVLASGRPKQIRAQTEGIVEVRNPLPAAGGVDAESMEHIRQSAPFAFRTQLRAVTEDDYGVVAQRDPAIREARGTLRWTGSWYTAFVSVDTQAPSGLGPTLLTAAKQRLNLFRMAGVDLEVEGAVIVGLRIEMNICVTPNHFQSHVRDAILRLFTIGDVCDGRRGILNPENFTFGQTIYTSPFIAAAQGVEGVSSVTMAVFQRMDDPSIDGAALGYLSMGRLEIARCDNDPNRLDHGIFVLHMDGGK